MHVAIHACIIIRVVRKFSIAILIQVATYIAIYAAKSNMLLHL